MGESMMTPTSQFLKSGALIAALFGAFGGKESGNATASGEHAAAHPASASHEMHADKNAANLSHVLASYERVRALLAEDQIAEVSAAAIELKMSAQEAVGKAPAALDEQVRAIAAAADALSATGRDDGAAVRRAFGDVSRPVVALIAADPKLAEGRHLFECPMAEGYKRWVQTNANVSNPYMGKKMPTCGSAAPWK
jgi:membrane fusion protein, copper/silver efflux system